MTPSPQTHTHALFFTPELCVSPRPGRATYSDKLFKFRNGRFEDLLNDDINEHRDVANRMAGRSVACVDRKVDTHTHTDARIQSRCRSADRSRLQRPLARRRACTAAPVCLPVITHALPTPPFPACAVTVHLGEWFAISSPLSSAPV